MGAMETERTWGAESAWRTREGVCAGRGGVRIQVFVFGEALKSTLVGLIYIGVADETHLQVVDDGLSVTRQTSFLNDEKSGGISIPFGARGINMTMDVSVVSIASSAKRIAW